MKRFSETSARPAQRRVPIARSLLTVSLAVAALSLALAFGGVQALLYEPAKHAVAQSELDNSARQVDAELTALFKRVDTIARLRRDWGALGLLSTHDEGGIVRLLGAEVMHEPGVSSVAIADDTGREVLLRKGNSGNFVVRLTDPAIQHGSKVDSVWTREGQMVDRSVSASDYDARQRPWYLQARDDNPGSDVVWTAPFVFRSTGRLGLSAIVQWTSPDGRLSTSTTDLTLDDISASTRQLVVSRHGFAAVLTDDGRVVGLPGGPAAMDHSHSSDLLLKPVSTLGQPALASAYELWRAQGSSPSARLYFQSGGVAWLANLSRIDLRGRASLYVVVVAPESESDFASVGAAQWLTLGGILLVTMALTAWAALRAARHFSAPLRQLASESERIGRLDLGRPVRVESRWQEVFNTATAQESMRKDLLRATEGLEAAVERRTQQLTVALEAAGEAGRAKAAFLANMSHEIRTPMNAIVGLTTLMQRTPVSDTQRSYLTRLDDAGRLLLHVVNDVLDYSKIEAGKLSLEHSEFALDDLLLRVGNMLGSIVRDKPLEVVFRRAPDVPNLLVGDAVRLEQVLINIAGNACKFTASGEVFVEVTCSASEGDRAAIDFMIRDTGIGMSSEQVQKLFQPFSQGDESMSRRFGGTGLGLAISKRLVELMGGSIRVESTLMVGSVFRISLPLQAPVVAEGGSSKKPWHLLSGLRALVVDDNASSREALCEILQSFDIVALGFASSEAGIDGFVRAEEMGEGFDLVLVDWGLPEVSGLEVIARMRALAPGSRTEFIMISAENYMATEQGIRGANLGGLILKPTTPSSLLDTILAGVGATMRFIGNSAFEPGAEMLLGGTPRHVLLVEDNEVNSLIASEFLKAAGVRVTVASSAQEAIALVESGVAFDLLFMDVQMAQMDGLEATRFLRSIPRGAHLIIVALTAHAMPGDRARCLAAGMDDYLTKPLSHEALLNCLHRWLRSTPDPWGLVTSSGRGWV